MSIHTRYTRLAIGVLAIASILLSAPAASEERLVIADGRGDWGGLAPYLHIPRGPGYVYTSFVFDTLLWKDETGKLSPALAQAWHHDDSGLCYRFTMREDATWHDGRVLGVDDVVFTIAYMQQHPYRFVDLGPIESARRLSERDAEICMHKPYAPFLTTIAASLPILPKHIYHKVEQPDRFRTSEAMIGSGPYRVDIYNRAQGRYRLLRNDNYYGGSPRYKAIHIAKMQPDAALVALQKGEVDVMAVSHDRVPQFIEAGVALQRQLSNHPYRLVFNHGGSFRETALRQALAYAIDRQALLDVVYPDRAIVAAVGYFQGDAATPDLAPYAYAPKKAAALLQAQGWERQTNGRWHTEDAPVTLSLIASPKARLLAEAVAAQLHTFGIEITLRLEQGPQLSQRLKKHNFDL
ncbi:MAG TPA: ABC transporter substrate-binding protein, partial [Gammaproteobacteria bacterium]|nr:ABC transporter substrate-binding protein [Gammaproteobacteria bacterium]